jgi:DNA polymerase-4
MPRKILHLDLDAFFCAVEEQRDPTLRGQAFAVGGQPETRGVVAACSYAARRFGIHSAMPMTRAIKLCPHLIIVPSHYAAYQAASQQVMARLHQLTPLVEQLSIDEAFLDVSDLPDPAEEVARRLQTTINTDLGLPCSLGVATNKLVAKMANNVGKAAAPPGQTPNALQVVPPGQEAAFLAPLPVEALWGVGPKTAERLHSLGLRTIGQMAHWPESDLVRRFGQHGADLARHARGLDERPVETEHEAKSISQETTFARDVSDGAILRETLHRSQRLKKLARSYGVGIGAGLVEANAAGFFYNSYVVALPNGELHCHRKLQAFEHPLIHSGTEYTRTMGLRIKALTRRRGTANI